jgi:hypothetical protein
LPREEVSVLHVKELSLAPAPGDLELDDAFFANEATSALEPLEPDAERDNPVLSPAQHRRRLQLRRQVGAVVAVLALFALLTLRLRFVG